MDLPTGCISIIDYVAQNLDNEWIPLVVNVDPTIIREDGFPGKDVIMPTNLPNCHVHFANNPTAEDIAKYQKNLPNCNTIAISTRKVCTLDVDTPESFLNLEEMKERFPYYLSKAKKLPHFFYTTTKTQIGSKSYLKGNRKLELLHGIWAFADKNAVVHNAYKPILSLDDEEPAPAEEWGAPKAPGGYAKVSLEEMTKAIKTLVPHHERAKVKQIHDNNFSVDCRWCPLIAGIHNSNHHHFTKVGNNLVLRCHSSQCLHKEQKYPMEMPANGEKTPADDKFTDRGMFDYVLKKFPGRIKMNSGTLLGYDADTGLWTERALAVFSKLTRDIFTVANGDNKRCIMDAFFFANELPDENNFFEKAIINSHGKLLYRDAVWDIRNSERIPFDMNYYFGYKIDRNIPTERDETVINKLRKAVFEDPHENPKVQREMAKQLAVGLTGENLARSFFGNMGPTGTGKSTTQKAFKKAYGGFVGMLNSSHLTISKYAGKNDHADYLVSLKYQRLKFISEIAPGEVWDGKLVKMLTGDDAISARKCGFGAGPDFYSQATVFSYAQGMADINPMDDAIRNRLMIVNWKVQFVKTEDGGKRDVSMIKWVETDEASDALFWVMKDAYELYKKEGFVKIEEITNYTSEIADEQDDFKREFDSKYTKKRDAKVLIADVYQTLKNFSNKTTLITSKLTSMGIVKGKVCCAGKWEGQQWAFVGLELKPVVCGFSHH